jgi:spore coat protein A
MKPEDLTSLTLSRRRLLQYGAAAGAALSLSWVTTQSRAVSAEPSLAKYVQALPVIGDGLVIATPSGANRYAFTQGELSRRLHPQLPKETPFWAYDDGSGLGGQKGSFGMILVAKAGTPLTVTYTNNLPTTYPAWIPVDTRLTPNNSATVRVMTHLHGGFVNAASDGNPSVSPNGFVTGETQTVTYPNQQPQQPASLLWFHDHGLGLTRLNVFAGLAAAYLLRDQYDTGAADNANGLPSGPYEIPMVIQDRMFNLTTGEFLYPKSVIPGVTWIGEYFGDTMLVNGLVWPFLNVEPRLYRFRILNGCNARILNLNMAGASMWQIGAEGGMWDIPVPVKRVVLAPAERADLLVDFGPVAGQTIVMSNTNPPKPIATPAPSLSQVMQFRVTAGTRVKPALPTTLIGGVKPTLDQQNPVRTRYITLNEIAPETANWYLNLNGLHFEAASEENPTVGTVEDWVYVNLTADTHPMHTHLVTFQVMDRTPFNVDAYLAAATAAGKNGPNGVAGGFDPTPYVTGPAVPADPTERGFKDTVMAHPAYLTRIRVKFDLPSGVTAPQSYVYHCHIVEHEDNDMMRPFVVTPS